MLVFSPGGVLLVSESGEGRVAAFPDSQHTGKAAREVTVLKGLNEPHGLAFYQGKLYVAENDKVRRYDWDEANVTASNPVKLADLPTGGEMFYTVKKISGTGIGHGKIASIVSEGVTIKTTSVPAMDMTLDRLTMAYLVRFDAANRPIPELATEVPTRENGDISADGKTITYHLRHDARWSDGVPFTAADARLVIPVRPGMRSLNVAVTAAMALGEALRQTSSAIKETAR